MSTKSIPLKTWEVQAILDGQKSTLRRVVKPHNAKKAKLCEYAQGNGLWVEDGYIKDYSVSSCWMKAEDYISKYVAYKPGDILWVRETFFRNECTPDCDGWDDPGRCPFTRVENYCYVYRAHYEDDTSEIKWHPSIHMPREAARLFLLVTAVRAERLQEITEDGAEAEGVPCEFPMEEVYCPVCNGDGLIGMYNSGSLGYAEIECPHCEKATTRFENLWNSTIKPADLPRYGWDANPFVWVVEFERCERPMGF